MLRAALSMNHPEYACATWSECIIFILRNAPIEAWLQEGINRAREGAEEEPEIDVTTSPDGEVRGPGCSDAGPIARQPPAHRLRERRIADIRRDAGIRVVDAKVALLEARQVEQCRLGVRAVRLQHVARVGRYGDCREDRGDHHGNDELDEGEARGSMDGCRFDGRFHGGTLSWVSAVEST